MPDYSLSEGDKRCERRVGASLPVTLEGLEGVDAALTRDVSASGMYFEVGVSLAPGALFDLTVEMETPTGKRILSGRGIIVRVDLLDNRFGCAVKILDSHLLKP